MIVILFLALSVASWWIELDDVIDLPIQCTAKIVLVFGCCLGMRACINYPSPSLWWHTPGLTYIIHCTGACRFSSIIRHMKTNRNKNQQKILPFPHSHFYSYSPPSQSLLHALLFRAGFPVKWHIHPRCASAINLDYRRPMYTNLINLDYQLKIQVYRRPMYTKSKILDYQLINQVFRPIIQVYHRKTWIFDW